MNRVFRYAILYLLIFLVIVGIFGTFNGKNKPTKELNYHEFVTALEDGQITEADIQPERLVFVVKGKLEGYKQDESFITNVPQDDQELLNLIRKAAQDNKNNINFLPAQESNGWLSLLTGIIPFIIIFILFFFLLNQSQGGGNRVMSFGKSKAKLYDDQKNVYASQM